jgi:heme exporter protein B
MDQWRAFCAILRWDLAGEFRRREATLNMCLFAVLILFIASYALAKRNELIPGAAPIFYWISIIFAGTVGLSRAFQTERESGALHGILVAPVDPGFFYLAKVAAAWIYTFAMALLVLAAYLVLFNFKHLDRIVEIVAVTAAFLLAYTAIGTLLAAMTTSLRGGEVLLRILLFPLMVPAIVAALSANERLFGDPEVPIASLSPWKAAAAIAAMAAIYLAASFLLFGKVVEE